MNNNYRVRAEFDHKPVVTVESDLKALLDASSILAEASILTCIEALADPNYPIFEAQDILNHAQKYLLKQMSL